MRVGCLADCGLSTYKYLSDCQPPVLFRNNERLDVPTMVDPADLAPLCGIVLVTNLQQAVVRAAGTKVSSLQVPIRPLRPFVGPAAG